MVVQERLLTVEEFETQYLNKRYELVRGVPIAMTPTGMLHQIVSATFVAKLWIHVSANQLGYVGSSEGGYVLSRDPDIVRGADASFIAFERVPKSGLQDGFFPVPPDLAVEVVSPNDRASEIMDKVEEYLQAGVRLVLVIYPKQRKVMIYRLNGTAQILTGDDVISGEDVVPGFLLPLSELWPSEPLSDQTQSASQPTEEM